MPRCLIEAILLSMVVASISFFISHSQLLEKFRNWVCKLGGARTPWQSFVGAVSFFFWKLITCCYCLGHWIAAALLLLMPSTRLLGVFWPIDYLFTWIIISWMAGIQSLAASQLWGE